MGVAVAPLILRRFAPQDKLVRPANVLTLSCKSRLTCLPQEAARRLPRLTREWQERTAADVPRACSSSRPRRLAAGPGDRRFLSAC